MHITNFSEYDVRQLICARKFAFRVVQNTTDSKDASIERKLVYEIRRADMPNKDIRLQLCARIPPRAPGVGVKPTPGVSLRWKGIIIRKVDHALKHPVFSDGIVVAHIKGWHEHVWTDEDEGKNVVAADPPIKGGDMRSVVSWAAQKWNIDLAKFGAQREFEG